MARPKKKIDIEMVRKLASIMCTYEEIAAMMNVSHDTIERRFASVVKEARKRGIASLRRKQYEVAMGGNVTALIWLGKNYMDQSDKVVHSNEELRKLPMPELMKLARKLTDSLEKDAA